MYQDVIKKYILQRKEEFLRDLEKLVSIDSQNGPAQPGKPYGEGPAAALDAFLQIAEAYGLHTENWDYHVGIVSFREEAERKLDILAHLDVVPAGSGWKETDAFVMKEKEGRVYGRGTADDKGPALAALYAMRAIRDLKLPVKEGVRLVVGCDEEQGGSDIDYYYDKTDYAPMTFSPDADYPVINIEKGFFSGDIFYRNKQNEGSCIVKIEGGTAGNVVPDYCSGEIRNIRIPVLNQAIKETEALTGTMISANKQDDIIKLEVSGVSTHASTPENGNNAITAMLELLSQLSLLNNGLDEKLKQLNMIFPHGDYNGKAAGIYISDEESGPITVSLNILRCTDGELYASFDARTPICANEENLKPVQILLKEAGFDCTFDISEPHYVPGNSEFVQTLLRNYEKVTRKEGYCIAMGGGTYVHSVPNGVAFGCAIEGIDNRMHGPDEFADINVLLESSMIFANVIIDLCS